MAKTAKSKLLHAVEQHAIEINQIPASSALNIDAMALVQSLPLSCIPATFGKLAKPVLTRICSQATRFKTTRVDFVIDVYREKSLKDAERCKRTSNITHSSQPGIFIQNGETKVPKLWKSYVASKTNKTALLNFFHAYGNLLTLNAISPCM